MGTDAKLMPPEKRIQMPTQNFSEQQGLLKTLKVSRGTGLTRAFVFLATTCLTIYASLEMVYVVGRNEATALQVVLTLLFSATFIWIAFGAANALLGFLAVRSHNKIGRGATLSARTAVVMPIYNEKVLPVFSAIARMAEEMTATGHASQFDFFVLSDTRDPTIAAQELEMLRRMKGHLVEQPPIYYRRRENNLGRKAGNIADFIQRWGGGYDFMLVLDADSYMTAEAMISLAHAMEQDSSAGLIQTVPQLVGGQTLWARLQQFATAIYGPIVARGFARWHGTEGNYWGHNAIVRIDAFAGACGLPSLPGRKPFGGEILSHDFVEAALLRRAGFAVYSRPDIDGSYEQTPPTLKAHMERDRRWAQGNLQHSKILTARGLHWVNRFHMVQGIMAYVASPLWLMFLVTGVVLSWEAKTFPPNYFPSQFSLFPTWPSFDAPRAFALLQFSLAVLLLPKLLALIDGLINPKTRKSAGGAVALCLSVIWETLMSALVAPILMLAQTRSVIDIIRGRDSGWSAQQRYYGRAGLQSCIQDRLADTAIGVAILSTTLTISLSVCLWLSPVWLGLLLAAPIDYSLASTGLGAGMRRLRLLRTPHEADMEQQDSPCLPQTYSAAAEPTRLMLG